MGTILFLIGFPIIIAVILLVSKEDKVRDVVVKFAALVIALPQLSSWLSSISNRAETHSSSTTRL